MTTNNNESQRLYLEFQMLSQQLNQLQQQTNSINLSINELRNLENSLKEIEKIKKGNEALIPLGNNIFIKGKIEDNKEIIMGIGSKTLTKKTFPEAKKIVEEQIKELEKINLQIEKEAINYSIQLERLQQELIKEESK